MRDLDSERRAIRQLVLEALGQNRNQPRGFTGQLRAFGLEHDILNLPVDAVAYAPIQDADGTFHFMPDVSVLDGPDLIM